MSVWRNLDKNRKLINAAALSRPFIVFDTETTGLSGDAQIIEIAAAKCLWDGKKKEFCPNQVLHTYIRPDKPVPDKIRELTGISNYFLADKPDERTAFPLIYDFFGDSPALGAYNSSFDINKLGALYGRNGKLLTPALNVDFLAIAKDVLCDQHLKDSKLCTVANYYGADEGIVFHSALEDVRVLIRVIHALIADILRNAADRKEVTLRKAVVYSIGYYKGYRGDERLYANTSLGNVFYAFKTDKWSPKDDDLSLEDIDMKDLQEQVFAKAEVSNYQELKAKCREGLPGSKQRKAGA